MKQKKLTKKEREDAMGDLLGIVFIIFLIVIMIIGIIGIVSATNTTGTINLTDSNLSEEDLFIDINHSILGNLNITGDFFTIGEIYLGELIKGNFIIKTMKVAIKKANEMIYGLQKEKNRLEKELIEANKIIKDMEENAEEFARDCEERIKKKYGVKE